MPTQAFFILTTPADGTEAIYSFRRKVGDDRRFTREGKRHYNDSCSNTQCENIPFH